MSEQVAPLPDRDPQGEAWVIFGASSGLGRAYARCAAAAGRPLVLAGRDVEDLEIDARDLVLRGAPSVRTLRYDASDPAHALAAANSLAAALPERFNVLIAFAVMPDQAEATADPALVYEAFAVNAAAAAALMLSLPPLMEARRGGCLLVAGSVAGDRVRARNMIYGASKAALHSLCGPLRARLARSGVTLTLAKPGPLDTPMTFGLDRRLMLADADECAAALWRAAGKGRREVYFPPLWRWIMLAMRLLPAAIFHRLRY